MLGEALASRFDLSDQVTEDKIGRHTSGRRQSDDLPVVLTVLDPQLKIDQAEVAAVAETSRRLAELRLTSILHCVEVGRTEGGNLYLVSEAAEFDTLKTRIRAENGLSTEESLAVAHRLASVLGSAAEINIPHQDLSSAFIHADFSGETLKVRLARYGYSRLLPSYAPTRKNEPFHGTAEYMAPEVCSGRAADSASDLYGLGILMYEMIAGKPPFVSSSPSTTIKRQVYEKPLPLHLVKPGTHNLEAYEKLVTRLLSKDPKGRPADPAELVEAIESLRTDHFPDTNLDREEERETAIEVVSEFEDSTPEESAGDPAKETEAVDDSRETMVFTGLAEKIAMESASKAAVADDESPAATGDEAGATSQPTEAFDPSLVKEALEGVAGKQQEKPREASLPEGSGDDGTKPEDWFVDGADQLPESAFPADEQEKKESRMFWVIVGAVAILVGVGAAIYFDGGQPLTPAPPEPVVSPTPPPAVEPPPTPTPAPEPEPASAPVPAPDTSPAAGAVSDPGPAAAQVPDPGPSTPTPEELKAERLASMLSDGRKAFEEGNLERARLLAEEIVAEEAGNSEARELLATVKARMAELKQEKEKAKKKKRRKVRKKPSPAPAVKPDVKPPAKKPAPEAKPSVEETQQKLRSLIRSGRDAYKRGDYQSAIKSYNKALSLDKNNALVNKLLQQAKSKAGQ